MKRYWEQLKPQERRWAVGIGVVVFLMLNYFFVWPHRNDWGRDAARMRTAMATNQLYKAEIAHKEQYTRELGKLRSDGSEVLPEDQAIDFIHFYSSREVSHKITPLNNGPLVTRTNEFFVEQQMGISVQADETNLVNFLYSLSEGSSMMRVRAMSLHPDPSHQQLSASLTLVASYQKKATAHAGAATARPTGSASVIPGAPGMVAPPVSPPPRSEMTTSPVPVPPPARTQLLQPEGSNPKPPGFFPRPPGSFSNSPDRTNRIAGPFARPTSPSNKLGATTAE